MSGWASCWPPYTDDLAAMEQRRLEEEATEQADFEAELFAQERRWAQQDTERKAQEQAEFEEAEADRALKERITSMCREAGIADQETEDQVHWIAIGLRRQRFRVPAPPYQRQDGCGARGGDPACAADRGEGRRARRERAVVRPPGGAGAGRSAHGRQR